MTLKVSSCACIEYCTDYEIVMVFFKDLTLNIWECYKIVFIFERTFNQKMFIKLSGIYNYKVYDWPVNFLKMNKLCHLEQKNNTGKSGRKRRL